MGAEGGTAWGVETTRLQLRRLQPGDGPVIFRYRSEPSVRCFQLGWPSSEEEAEQFVQSQQAVAFDTPETWFQIALELKETGTVAGDLGVRFLEAGSRQVELGFTIAPSYQRKGIAREAMMALLGHLFEDCRKHRVILRMDAQNAAAIALATSLGFRKEAHFEKSFWSEDRWTDEVVYALLRAEWSA